MLLLWKLSLGRGNEGIYVTLFKKQAVCHVQQSKLKGVKWYLLNSLLNINCDLIEEQTAVMLQLQAKSGKRQTQIPKSKRNGLLWSPCGRLTFGWPVQGQSSTWQTHIGCVHTATPVTFRVTAGGSVFLLSHRDTEFQGLSRGLTSTLLALPLGGRNPTLWL